MLGKTELSVSAEVWVMQPVGRAKGKQCLAEAIERAAVIRLRYCMV